MGDIFYQSVVNVIKTHKNIRKTPARLGYGCITDWILIIFISKKTTNQQP